MRGTLLGDKSHSAIFDNSKLKSFVPQFKATIPYYRGISKTIEWFEQNKLRMQVNAENDSFIDSLIANYMRK